MVRPIQQQHLPLELVLAGRDDRIELVALAQLLEFGIAELVEPEQPCVLALNLAVSFQ